MGIYVALNTNTMVFPFTTSTHSMDKFIVLSMTTWIFADLEPDKNVWLLVLIAKKHTCSRFLEQKKEEKNNAVVYLTVKVWFL